MTIPFWLFLLVILWAIITTVLCFFRTRLPVPVPFPDYGHRCFAVPDEHAAWVVGKILANLGGLPELFTFDPKPTHQLLLRDGMTVIIWHDKETAEMGLPPNGLSVVSTDPLKDATEAVAFLQRAGYKANLVDLMQDEDNKLVILTSSAFDGWVLTFRRHILKMGPPPNQRKLLK